MNNNVHNGVKKLEQNLPFIRLDSSSMVIAPTANSSKSLTTWLCWSPRLVNNSIHLAFHNQGSEKKLYFYQHIIKVVVSVVFGGGMVIGTYLSAYRDTPDCVLVFLMFRKQRKRALKGAVSAQNPHQGS